MDGFLICVVSYLFAAVALSVIDTSSSNFFAENWTQFPYLEGGELPSILESSSETQHATEKKVNNAAVTVNSNKEDPATSAISSRSLSESGAATGGNAVWGPKWIGNLTDVIGISNRVIKDQTKRKHIFSTNYPFVLVHIL